jgi:Protein of unknown function (DUF1360)
MSYPFECALGVLCVWRITYLFVAEDGPGGILVRFRQSLGEGFWGELLDCFYCLSLWTAAPFALLIGRDWRARLFLWFALSAGAILIERLTHRPAVLPASYIEDKENPDELLRQIEDSSFTERDRT